MSDHGDDQAERLAGGPAYPREMTGAEAAERIIHTIAPELPREACHWPTCADPVCARNENGTCPLADEIIVECRNCGAARGLGKFCSSCGYSGTRDEVPRQVADDEGEAARAAAAAPPVRRGNNGKVIIVDDDATVIRASALRGLLTVAGDMRTLAEALGTSPSTISRALSHELSPGDREQRIHTIRLLLGSEEQR